MGAVNVLMLLLVWTVAAFCKDDDITCKNVIGHVGKELTLTCRVSDQSNTCEMKYYKFIKKEGTQICRENFTDPCQQLSIFSCPYTANEVMTSSFKFFIQTTHGVKSADFTVTITEVVNEDGTGELNRIEVEPDAKEKAPVQAGDRSALAVIISILSCFIIIVMGLYLRKKRNTINNPEFQRGEVCACQHAKEPPV